MDLSIVIVSYNTKDMLRDCLNSLPGATTGLTYETWVVDNNSPDRSADMVAAEFPNVKLIANDFNAGFPRANNQALKQCHSRHSVILNPDTECRPGALATLVRYLDEHSDVGAVGPKLLNTDGSLQPNGARFPNPVHAFLVISELRCLFRAKLERHLQMRDSFDVDAELDVVSGACMMVRGTVIDQVGDMDEDFFMFFEETEWCWRIKKAGWKIVYVASAEIVHHWMGSVRDNYYAMTALLFRSSDIYYRKTGTPWTRFLNRGVMAFGMAKNNFIHAGVRVKRWLRGLRGAAR